MSEKPAAPEAAFDSPEAKKDVYEGYDPSVKIRTKKMLMYVIIFAIVMLFGGLTSGYIVKNGGSYWVHVDPSGPLWNSLIFLVLSSVTVFVALKMVKRGNQNGGFWLTLVTFALGVGFLATQYYGWKDLADHGMGVTITDVFPPDTDLTDSNARSVDKYSWNHIDQITGEYGKDYYIYKGSSNNRLILQDGEFYLPSDKEFTKPVTNEIRAQSNNSSAFVFVLLFVHFLHLCFGLIYLIVNAMRIRKNRIHADDTISLYTNGMYWHFMGILWVYLFVFLFVFH